MDFAVLQTNFTDWVEGLATDRTGAGVPVEWGRMPQKVHTGPFILAYLGAIVQRGQDVKRYDYDEVTDALDETMVGFRRATFRLSFRNFDQRLGYGARYWAERFRTRTQSTFGIQSLPDPLGFQSTGELVETDYEWNGHMVNQVDMDVVLNFWMQVIDTDYDGAHIQSVNMEAQNYLLDEMGNPIEDTLGNPVVDLNIREITVSSLLAP